MLTRPPLRKPPGETADSTPAQTLSFETRLAQLQSQFGRAFVDSVVCGELLAYGSGCPGSGGFTPSLSIGACATPGGPVDLLVNQGLGGALCLLFVSPPVLPLTLPWGCVSWVNLSGLFFALPLQGSAPGLGWAKVVGDVPMGIPNGTAVVLQAFVHDGGAPHGFSASNAVQLTVY